MIYAEFYSKAAAWFREGIWRIRLKNLPRYQAFPLRWLRIVVLSLREFSQDKGSVRASALTFYSVLAVVPLVAMAFGIAKGFGMEAMLEGVLRSRLEGQEEIANRILEFSQNQLQQTRGGLVAGAGIILLLWTATRVLSNIELSFNAIWKTEKNRNLIRKVGDYLAFLFLAPIFLISASSLTVFLLGTVQSFAEGHTLWGLSGTAATLIARLLPAVLLWMLFSGMYLFMPNTRVPVLSALVGGVCAGTMYQVAQAIYINFQIGAAGYGAIYGSFAALPLFLIWLQISWTIVLYGAELAYAHQHVDEHEADPGAERSSAAMREYAALAVMHRCVMAMKQGIAPPTMDALCDGLQLPRKHVLDAIEALLEVRLLVRASYGDDGIEPDGYFPARDINQLHVADVLTQLRENGANHIPPSNLAELRQLRAATAALNQALVESPENLRIMDVADTTTSQ